MTTDQPLVSIITPVYNGSKYIEKLIESVRNQDYPNIEHIVINDGSTDDSATVAILKRYSHLRWWSRENRGQYPTMNEGLEKACGELVCFISADDLMTPGAVRCAVEFLQTHPNYDGVYGSYFWIDEKGFPHRAQNLINHAPLSFYRYHPFIGHCSLFLRKTTLDREGLSFNEKLHYVGDFDWIMRLIESNIKLGYINEVFSYVRSHKEQTSHHQAGEMAEELLIVLKKHGVSHSLYKIINFVIYWLSASQRAGRILWKSGPRGLMQLVKEWQQRRKVKNS